DVGNDPALTLEYVGTDSRIERFFRQGGREEHRQGARDQENSERAEPRPPILRPSGRHRAMFYRPPSGVHNAPLIAKRILVGERCWATARRNSAQQVLNRSTPRERHRGIARLL